MGTLWLIPIHVRPVVSYEALVKKRTGDPVSGMDRFNLTDVGDVFLRVFMNAGADMKTRNFDPPFPWEMVFMIDDAPKAFLKGIRIGPSTYRSLFKLDHSDEPAVRRIVSKCLSSLGRDPLDSPYWDDENWQLLQKMFKRTRESLIVENRSFIK